MINDNWIHETTDRNVKQKAEKLLSIIKNKRYNTRKIKSIKLVEIPNMIPRTFKEVIEYYD